MPLAGCDRFARELTLYQIIAEKARAWVYTDDATDASPSEVSGSAPQRSAGFQPLQLGQS